MGSATVNELMEPTTVDVPEAGSTGLKLTIANTTGTSGIDGFGGLPSLPLTFPFLKAFFRLDAAYEFLTFSFNQSVTVIAIGITNPGAEGTFQFGAATKVTDLSK